MAFLQVYFNGDLKFVCPLEQTVTKIGRYADNDIVIDNAGVSGHHAVVIRDGDDFFIHDMASTNGIFLNGRKITGEQIHFGDEITLHKHKLKFTAVNLSGELATGQSETPVINQNRTMEVDVSQLQALLQQQQACIPYLQQLGGDRRGTKWMLSKAHFDIGKGDDCDLQLGGWMTPKLIARISRQSDGYYLYPESRWRRVRLNGEPVNHRIRLQNRDRLSIVGVQLTFCQSAPPPIGR